MSIIGNNPCFAGAYSAEYWEYDSRLGRRWNVDPIFKDWESPYATFSNNPIFMVDIKGDSGEYYDTNGKKLFVSHDNLPNAVIIIPDDKLAGFKAAVASLEKVATPEIKNSAKVNTILRSYGVSYETNGIVGLFEKYKTATLAEENNNYSSIRKDGKNVKLYSEYGANLVVHSSPAVRDLQSRTYLPKRICNPMLN